MPTRLGEALIKTEGARLGNAPRMHLLTPHAIPEPSFPLEDQNSIAVFRKAFRHR